jgi:hypothetical protein
MFPPKFGGGLKIEPAGTSSKSRSSGTKKSDKKGYFTKVSSQHFDDHHPFSSNFYQNNRLTLLNNHLILLNFNHFFLYRNPAHLLLIKTEQNLFI